MNSWSRDVRLDWLCFILASYLQSVAGAHARELSLPIRSQGELRGYLLDQVPIDPIFPKSLKN